MNKVKDVLRVYEIRGLINISNWNDWDDWSEKLAMA